MPNTILVVEDEPRMREIIRDYFTSHGADCDLARDGAEALDLLSDHDYDAILLDVMMPNLDGFAVCQAVRRENSVPIIFFTALYGEENALKGYELGADDYLTKPFSLAVLYAKTMALIRRGRGDPLDGETLSCGAISLHLGQQICRVHDKEISLPPREYDLLECLLRHKGQVLSRARLLDKVWGLDFEGDERAVDVQIKNLRTNLGNAGNQIKTVIKAGYKLEEGAR